MKSKRILISVPVAGSNLGRLSSLGLVGSCARSSTFTREEFKRLYVRSIQKLVAEVNAVKAKNGLQDKMNL